MTDQMTVLDQGIINKEINRVVVHNLKVLVIGTIQEITGTDQDLQMIELDQVTKIEIRTGTDQVLVIEEVSSNTFE